MDKKELFSIITKEPIIAEFQKIIGSLELVTTTAQSVHQDQFNFEEYSQIEQLSEPISALIKKQLPENTGENLFMVFDGGFSSFSFDTICHILVKKALTCETITGFIEFTKKILLTKKAIGSHIVVVWGITPKSKCKLTDDIIIVPISELPNSKKQSNLINYQLSQFMNMGLPIDAPSAAIILKFSVEPFLGQLDDKAKQKITDDYLLRRKYVDDILLCLTLIGPCIPTKYKEWFQYDDPEIEEANIHTSFMFPKTEILPMVFRNIGQWDEEKATIAINKFLHLESGVKNKIRVSLERLNLAMRRSYVGDKAVDLSIALESILAEGIGENTHKVSLRSAIIIGGEINDQLRIRAIIGSLYTIRSNMVHNGQVDNKVKPHGLPKMGTSIVVDEAIKITAQIICKILEKNTIPDWYEFELTSRMK